MRFARRSLLVSLTLLLFLPTARAQSILPDWELSIFWTDYPGPETVACVVHPDGRGSRLDEARIWGQQVDATIHVQLFDPSGTPVVGYPREDMWLKSWDDRFVWCPGGTIADVPTDQNGESFWVTPLSAGGFSEDLTTVVVSGAPIVSSLGLNIRFNSPDLNGDLEVDLADVAQLGADYFGGVYKFRTDLYYDGVINLSDIGAFVQGFATACP